MILLQNSLLQLDYTPATDILEVEYPDLHDFLLPEIKHNIDQMIENIKNFDIKKVLLDSTKTIIAVSEQESKEVASYLAAGLLKTRVVKVARVQSRSTAVELTAQENIRHIQASLTLPFQLRNFTSKEAALTWMKGNL